MKRIFSLALVAVLALFTACEIADTNGANFKLTSSNSFEIGAEGGNVYFTYSIDNPVQGASVATTVVSGQEAVKSVTIPTEGVVVVDVKANTSSQGRIIIVKASYNGESFDVVISQKSTGSGSSTDSFDVEFEGLYFDGYYFGESYGEGSDRYVFYISDKGFNNGGQAFTEGTYYYIDCFAPANKSFSLPYGTYYFSATESGEPYTVVGANSQLIITGTTAENTSYTLYSDAKMIVAANRVTLELTLNGKRHKVVYTGSLECEDVSGENGDNGGGDNNDPTGGQDGQAQSTLTSDRHVTFDGEYRAKWGYEGDYWNTGYSNYTIFIMNKSNGYVYGDTLQFDLITDNTSKDGKFAGKYTISDKPGKMVMMAGFTNNYAQAVGSWLYEYGGSSASGYANYAMIKSGTAEFIDNGDGTHTVILDSYDYKGNKITCNWTGVIEKD